MNWNATLGNIEGFFLSNIDVFEKRAGARSGFRVGKFVGADGGNYFADVYRCEDCFVVVENVFFDGIIKWALHPTDF